MIINFTEYRLLFDNQAVGFFKVFTEFQLLVHTTFYPAITGYVGKTKTDRRAGQREDKRKHRGGLQLYAPRAVVLSNKKNNKTLKSSSVYLVQKKETRINIALCFRCDQGMVLSVISIVAGV